MPYLVVLDQTLRAYVRTEIRGNKVPSRPAFQGHSRSLEPTRIDRLPMTFCYWSIVTTDLSRTVFEINGDFGRIANFFHPLCI